MDVAQYINCFQEKLEARGLKFTRQRRALAEVFFLGQQHVSLNELLLAAKEKIPGIGYATVYRTMRLLTEVELACEHRFGETETRYETNCSGEHHDHLICRTCGVIMEFEDELIEQRQEDIVSQRGFRLVGHRHEIYVECIDSNTCVRDNR